MKKLLVALLAICVAFSCFGVVAFAEAAPATDATNTTVETKAVESLIGAYYIQGECGGGLTAGGGTYTSETDYTIADKMAAALTGTNRIPFYAYDKDNAVYFDKFAKNYLVSEINAAAAAGIDFFAYKYYSGFTATDTSTLIPLMNQQLKRHMGLYSQPDLDKKLNFAVVLDGDFAGNKSFEVEALVDNILVVEGYLTAEDGRPVVFILWNDGIETQISKINRRINICVSNGLNEKKPDYPLTALDGSVEKAYFVVLNAPSYDEAIAAGADAVSWYEGTGKDGEAYTNMTAKVEQNWSSASENVIPNVVTGFDKTLLADNPIEITGKKYPNVAADVRYSRTGTKSEYVAKATPEELVAHLTNAIATTNKPANFDAVMMYAWDDFMGGAYLCPTKTDKAFQYDYSYLTALRAYIYNSTEWKSEFTVFDNSENVVVTAADGTVTTYKGGSNEVISKVDKDGNAVVDATKAPADVPNGDNGGNEGGDNNMILYIIIGAAAVVVIAVVVIIIVAKPKKKK